MGKNIVVYDIETKYIFDEVGGRDKFQELGISVLGAYDYAVGDYLIYEESALPEFAKRLKDLPLLVGFNSRRFDTPILAKNVPIVVKDIPQLDIMEELVKALGHRVSLDSVAKATLGIGKSGSGLDAIKYYREGKIAELKKYCLDDVRITKEIFEYGAKHGELFYTSKFGAGKARAPVSWEIKHPDEDKPPDPQQTLF